MTAVASAPPAVPVANTSSFYVTGGTLRQDSASYVVRQADTDLYANLAAGEYCYVLNSRQMGKSSLMVRTSQRLKAEGHTIAVLDLTAIGQNLTPEQWYDGLLNRLGRQLDREDELDDFYLDNERLSPLQRCFTAIEQILLPAVKKQLIVFVDEIDVVRSLPFSADEFFAAIRQCYVARATNPAYNRLTFCLLGTATPADLVKDTRVSPFNIGRRIEVRDFTHEEAAPLAAGLGANGNALLQRVLHWTGGHPYLTQLLCRSVAERGAGTPGQVDSLCTELFLTHKAKETDDNLMFVRNRLLNNEAEVAALLDLYAHVRQGWRVPDDESNPLTDILKLSGVVRVEDGLLRVRNRIYGEVFDKAWIVTHMPDAELRRQRAAYRRGQMRALALSSVVVLLVSILAGWAFRSAQEAKSQTRRADEKTQEANLSARQSEDLARKLTTALHESDQQKRLAQSQQKLANQSATAAQQQKKIADENTAAATASAIQARKAKQVATRNAQEKAREAERANRLSHQLGSSLHDVKAEKQRVERLSYANLMGRAQTALSQGNVSEARTYLRRYLRPSSPAEDLRGFEWRYLMRECRDSSVSLFKGHQKGVSAIAFSPDGSQIASAETGNALCLWNPATGKQTYTKLGLNPQRNLHFLRDGHTLVIGSGGRTIFWNAQTDREQQPPFPAHSKTGSDLGVYALALSPDEKRLACGLHSGRIDLWDVSNHRLLKSLYHDPHGDDQNAFVPVNDLAFSPDGKMLASGCSDSVGNNSVKLWNLSTFQEITTLTSAPKGDNQWGHMNSLAFSPEGRYIVTGGDQVVRLWNVATRSFVEIGQHGGSITRVVFAPNKRWLATSSGDSTIQVFDATGIDAGKMPVKAATLRGHIHGVEAIAFSPDSRMLVSGSLDKTLKLWDIEAAIQPMIQAHRVDRVGPLCFSSDGKLLATGSYQEGEPLDGKQVRLWDATTRKLLVETPPHIHGSWDSTYMCFAPDGKTVAVASVDGTLTLCDARTGKETARFEGTQGYFNVIAFSPDGKWIATGDRKRVNEAQQQGHLVRLWNVATRREVREFAQRQAVGHDGWVLALAFSPDSKTLVSGGGNGEVRWWDVVGQKEINTPMRAADGRALPSKLVHRKDISSLAFSPNGLWLAMGSEDNSASLWSVRTRARVGLMQGNQSVVTSVAFAPDGKTLATAGRDGTVKLWSLATLKQNMLLDAVTLPGGHNGIRTLAFAPDGNTLATGHFDGTVLFWQAAESPASATRKRSAARTYGQTLRPVVDNHRLNGVPPSVRRTQHAL